MSFLLLLKNVKVNTHRTTILPVVLYGCETLSLTLIEEQRLRLFENKVAYLEKYLGLRRSYRKMEKVS